MFLINKIDHIAVFSQVPANIQRLQIACSLFLSMEFPDNSGKQFLNQKKVPNIMQCFVLTKGLWLDNLKFYMFVYTYSYGDKYMAFS